MTAKPPSEQEPPEAEIAAVFAHLPPKGRTSALQRVPGEAQQARRVAGIIFIDGAAGRRARIAGTGVDVFEVIRDYLDTDKDLAAVHSIYDGLTLAQLDAALAYYAAYPEEIAARLALDEEFARTFDHRHG